MLIYQEKYQGNDYLSISTKKRTKTCSSINESDVDSEKASQPR